MSHIFIWFKNSSAHARVTLSKRMSHSASLKVAAGSQGSRPQVK